MFVILVRRVDFLREAVLSFLVMGPSRRLRAGSPNTRESDHDDTRIYDVYTVRRLGS